MQWDSKLATGIPLVDSQHKMMFDRLDILLDKNAKNRVAETLDFLGEYVLRHFGCEEMMMKCAKFPDTDHHIRLHKEFVEKYLELKHEYENGEENMLTLMKLTSFVQTWLYEHIMTKDKVFAEYFNRMHSKEDVPTKSIVLTPSQHSA